MSQTPSEVLQTPVSDLEWVIISGEGKENTLNGNMEYQASLVLDPDNNESHKTFVNNIDAFWKANKPTKYKQDEPKSNGLYPHKVPTGEKDEDGDNIYEETGKLVLATKTKTTFKDGNQKVIKVFNAKGAEISLGDKKIANGSRGRLKVVMSIYEQKDKKGNVLAAGVSFYLNGVQLSKFVEYEGAGFDALEDEDGDGFEGVGDMGGITDDEASSTTEKPRLD